MGSRDSLDLKYFLFVNYSGKNKFGSKKYLKIFGCDHAILVLTPPSALYLLDLIFLMCWCVPGRLVATPRLCFICFHNKGGHILARGWGLDLFFLRNRPPLSAGKGHGILDFKSLIDFKSNIVIILEERQMLPTECH